MSTLFALSRIWCWFLGRPGRLYTGWALAAQLSVVGLGLLNWLRMGPTGGLCDYGHEEFWFRKIKFTGWINSTEVVKLYRTFNRFVWRPKLIQPLGGQKPYRLEKRLQPYKRPSAPRRFALYSYPYTQDADRTSRRSGSMNVFVVFISYLVTLSVTGSMWRRITGS